MQGYKSWKMINESFNQSYNLGVKTPSNLGLRGSKLAEMGFSDYHPKEDDEFDDEELGDEDLEGDELHPLGDDEESDEELGEEDPALGDLGDEEDHPGDEEENPKLGDMSKHYKNLFGNDALGDKKKPLDDEPEEELDDEEDDEELGDESDELGDEEEEEDFEPKKKPFGKKSKFDGEEEEMAEESFFESIINMGRGDIRKKKVN